MSATRATFAFVEDALDRADLIRDDPSALAAAWPRARVVVLDGDGNVAADTEGALLVVTGADFGEGPGDDSLFLGQRGDEPWFAVRTDDHTGLDVPRRVDLRTAAATWPAFDATTFAQARAVLHWRARHPHCSVCGGLNAFVRGGWLARCTQCTTEHYPRTDPAVIVAVSDGERLLLGRQANWPPRRYSTLAGFVEPGESLEQTVMREVLEESGVRITASRYLASQPWPFPSSLMLGFSADAEPDVPVFGDELEDARWFTFEEVDAAIRGGSRGDGPQDEGLLLSPSISISYWLIRQWHADMAARRR